MYDVRPSPSVVQGWKLESKCKDCKNAKRAVKGVWDGASSFAHICQVHAEAAAMFANKWRRLSGLFSLNAPLGYSGTLSGLLPPHADSTRTLDRTVSSEQLGFCSRSLYAVARPSVVCLSSVTFVHPTQAVVIFRNISMTFGTLPIRRHPQKILWRSSQGNPSAGGVKHKMGSKI